MIICGVELKSNNVIVSIIDTANNDINYIDIKVKKLSLNDDQNQTSIVSFKNQIDNFIQENTIDKIVIKKRAKKGNFAGGVITFKIESIIQLNSHCKVEFVTAQAITKYLKNNDVKFPDGLNKYQEQAYLSTLILL
ncbi:MAG: DUF3010 domain-containing protein [Epsilonproteobacteria bacterium]|nr:MAG: DUF3010 domain-containing protein [Campylobacterota bacterium]